MALYSKMMVMKSNKIVNNIIKIVFLSLNFRDIPIFFPTLPRIKICVGYLYVGFFLPKTNIQL